jgi:pilus assembly protein FimV
MPPKMRSTTRPTLGLFTIKTLSAAVASVLLLANAQAAGLGKLTVLSALGQPLRAEIELTAVSDEEAATLVPRLASVDAFRQANVDYNAALMSLRFAIEQRGGRHLIRVTSQQPLNEPFVDMLLELGGPNGRLVREYTFLLDPADLRTAQPAQVAPAAMLPSRSSKAQEAEVQPAHAAKPASSPRPSAQGSSAPASSENARHGYQVRSGDTLAGIAAKHKANGISLDQMLVALFQSNPDAFVGKNMNRLKAGQILAVPSADAARGIDQAQARTIVVAQSADFNAYRGRLAGQVATTAPRKAAEATQSASGKITTKVEEKTSPANESKDKLKLSGAMNAPVAGSESSAGAAAAERIAKEKAIAEANARVKELEKNVSDLQKILEIKNKDLAEQQGKAEMPAAKTPEPTPAAVPSPAVTDEGKPAASAPVKDTAPVVAKPKRPAPLPTPAPEPSFVDDLMSNPLVLPGIGALLVCLGALGIYSARRKKQGRQFEDSIITDSSLKANSLFGSTGGQSVDTNNSVFNSSFAPSASQLDTNEVDPVAEADVYIAYGRDAQAEEILKEALRTQPERQAVRVKLLEIYSNRKDLRAFEVLATELYGMTKGEGEEWAQAAALGAAIDPNNPLYAGSKTVKDPAVDVNGLVAPTQPLDEQGLATLLATTQSGVPSEMSNALETDTSYFSNTALATETPLQPAAETSPEPVAPAPSHDLDFDLDGMMQNVEVPNTIPHPMASEPSADMMSIDFDFLDAPGAPQVAAPEEPVSAEEPAPTPTVHDEPTAKADKPMADDQEPAVASTDVPAMEFDIPTLPDEPAIVPAHAADADPLDFDLSDISLELNPSESQAVTEPATEAPSGQPVNGVADLSSSDAEMATKLDLALAYQEIGDKEGARELLDEVLKGGSSEQSERAKALLHELA